MLKINIFIIYSFSSLVSVSNSLSSLLLSFPLLLHLYLSITLLFNLLSLFLSLSLSLFSLFSSLSPLLSSLFSLSSLISSLLYSLLSSPLLSSILHYSFLIIFLFQTTSLLPVWEWKLWYLLTPSNWHGIDEGGRQSGMPAMPRDNRGRSLASCCPTILM